MIAFDTNLLVRLVTEDDPRQLAEVMSTGQTCLLTDIVLCELEWVLTSASYGANRSEVLRAVQSLVAEPFFAFESADRLRRALNAYAQGRGDLADYLLGEAGADLGARTTFTFDKALRSHPTFTFLQAR